MIYQVFGDDAHKMTRQLLEAAKVIERIPKGGSVALKPNLVIAGRPEGGATTHPGVLSGCIEYLQENGITDISVIEGSWVGESSTTYAAHVAGYDKVCEKYDVPFYELKKDKTTRVKTPTREMEICDRALKADFLINLPVLKGHCQTRMTCALKNLKGCIPDREKRKFHTEGLHTPIAALGATLKPHLIIVDSICGDLDFEEGGNPVQSNRMYMGTDPVQIDAYGCQLMGIPLSEVPYIKKAEKWGGGTTRVTEEDIINLNQPKAETTPYKASRRVAQLTRGIVNADSACSACYASLVRALNELENEGFTVREQLYIGQGWKGQSLKGVGIGACCAGAQACAMGCPPTAEAVKKVLEQWG